MGQLTYPDYGAYPSTVITPEGDLGELAARTGGPKYRREGRILSFANCSPGLDGWVYDASVMRVTYNPAIGTSCLYCHDTPPLVSTISKYLPISSDRRMGFEFMFNNQHSNNIIIFEITFWEGSTAKISRISITPATGDILYQANGGAGGGYVLLVNTPVISNTGNWIDAKMIADADHDEYIRLWINNTEYPINSELRHEAVAPAKYGTFLAIYGYSYDGVNEFRFSIDSMILTTNEY